MNIAYVYTGGCLCCVLCEDDAVSELFNVVLVSNDSMYGFCIYTTT